MILTFINKIIFVANSFPRRRISAISKLVIFDERSKNDKRSGIEKIYKKRLILVSDLFIIRSGFFSKDLDLLTKRSVFFSILKPPSVSAKMTWSSFLVNFDQMRFCVSA